jgi:ketopantoate reductase
MFELFAAPPSSSSHAIDLIVLVTKTKRAAALCQRLLPLLQPEFYERSLTLMLPWEKMTVTKDVDPF